MATPIAIVQKVTLANGGFRYMRGLTRGYVRVDVIDPLLRKTTGIVKTNHKAHLGTIYESGAGIFGVTHRSKYELKSAMKRARQIAHDWNVAQAV
jgi:hypothetical protein